MATSISDDFNRADNDSLGAEWEEFSESNYGIQISSNRLCCRRLFLFGEWKDSSGHATYKTILEGRKIMINFKASVGAAWSGLRIRVYARTTSYLNNLTCYYMELRGTSANCRFRRMNNGVAGDYTSIPNMVLSTSSQIFKWVIETFSDKVVHKLYIDEDLKYTINDTDADRLVDDGYVGFEMNGEKESSLYTTYINWFRGDTIPVYPYGNGEDGVQTVSANSYMDRDFQFSNLTIDSGVTLNTAGYTLKVRGILTNNGTITDSSSGGAGGTSGIGGDGHINDGDGTAGSDAVDGSSSIFDFFGQGGYGGGGGGGGAGQHYVSGVINFQTTGGDGGAGGNGGKGGGEVVIYAKTLTNNGTIHTNGFAGANGTNGTTGEYAHSSVGSGFDIASGGGGGGGGGSGGNGGIIFIIYESKTTGTVTAIGGSAGNLGIGGFGFDCICSNPDGYEYAGGNKGRGRGDGGLGGYGREGVGDNQSGYNGASGSTGDEGLIFWTQYDSLDSGLNYYDDGIHIIKCEELDGHKLRFRKGDTTVGIPLVAIADDNASPLRIYDGGVKALEKLI